MNSFCRLCGGLKEPVELLYKLNDISTTLGACCQWEWQDSATEAKLPQRVCEACYERLDQSWQFSQAIEKVQQAFLKRIIRKCAVLPPKDAISTCQSEPMLPQRPVDSEMLPDNPEVPPALTAQFDIIRSQLSALSERLAGVETIGSVPLPKPNSTTKIKTKSIGGRNRKCLCTVCGKVLSRSDNLKKHIKAMHGENAHRKVVKCRLNLRYECYVCHAEFSRIESVARHMGRRHLTPQMVRCDCGKVFATMYNLRLHMRKCNAKEVRI